jgi:hypothetical protein
VDFAELLRFWRGLLLSNRALFEGRRMRRREQGAEVVQMLWMEVEMWERGTGLNEGGGSFEFEALAELGGGLTVAEEAEGSEVVEVALAAAFGYGPDVVGVPEGSASGDGGHAVEAEASDAGGAAGSLEGAVGGEGVDVAGGADAVVAGVDLIAEVAGVGAETPLMDAVFAAVGAAAFDKDFKLAPAAKWKAVGSGGKGLTGGAAAGEGSGGGACLILKIGGGWPAWNC